MLILNLAAATDKFIRRNERARQPLANWVEITEAAEWHSILDVRQSWSSADAIKGTDLTCFDLAGNHYRLMTVIIYQRQEVLVVELITHAEYDRKYVR